jgi:hypothetical protein
MARIRSVHPGLFTDEAFASLSSDSQIFLIGLWTEADDQGVFEWKPLSLRMRLRPTKDGPVDHLLEEIVGANVIRFYEIEGRKYGAIRNFRKYQRPKSPNAIHPITNEIGNYTALTRPISEIDGDEGTPTSEIAPQRKEEGGREGGKKENKDAAGAAPARYAFESGIIRLNPKDFEQWRSAFSNLDLAAELLSLSQWAESEGKNWFHAVKGALAKRNREVKAKAKQEQQQPFKWNSGMEGIL